jgi:hypothetical protein
VLFCVSGTEAIVVKVWKDAVFYNIQQIEFGEGGMLGVKDPVSQICGKK